MAHDAGVIRGRMQLSNKTIVGVAVVLFGAVLLGAGIHHVITTGTCSSTGYSANYGPVPYCPAGTGWWIGFLIVGIMLVVLGSLVSGGLGFLLIFVAIGFGAISVVTEKHPASGSKLFGVIFGACFAAGGGIPLLLICLSRIRSRPRHAAATGASSTGLSETGLAGSNDPILGAYAATKATPPAPPAAIGSPGTTFSTPLQTAGVASQTQSSGDPLAKIERLSKLHQDGALTDAEFQREKERLLAEL